MKDRNSKENLRGDIIFLDEIKKAIERNDTEETLKLVKDWKHELNEMDAETPVFSPWCRIYQVDGNQILVRVKRNTEEDQMELSQTVQLEGMFLEASIGFEDTENGADKAFEKYNEQSAEKFLNGMINFLKEN